MAKVDPVSRDEELAILISEAHARIEELEAERRQLRLDACGIGVGDIVRITSAHNGGRLAIVRSVEVRFWEKIGAKPNLTVSLQKRDDDWSRSLFRAFNHWELVERAIQHAE